MNSYFTVLEFMTLGFVVGIWCTSIAFLAGIFVGGFAPTLSNVLALIMFPLFSLTGVMVVLKSNKLFTLENYFKVSVLKHRQQFFSMLPILATLVWADIWLTIRHSGLEMDALFVTGIALAIAWVPLMRYYYLKSVW